VANHQSLTAEPPYEKRKTEVIIPREDRMAVSGTLKPAKMPVVGPITNLNMLTRNTVPYLKNRSAMKSVLRLSQGPKFLFNLGKILVLFEKVFSSTSFAKPAVSVSGIGRLVAVLGNMSGKCSDSNRYQHPSP
jgi:hypothetical protein